MATGSEARRAAASALAVVLESAFPGDATLIAAVQGWIGQETSLSPRCAVCARSLPGLVVVEPSSSSWLRLLHGKNAGTRAVCGYCIEAAVDRFASAAEGGPRWDMVMAQLERAIALLPDELASIARSELAARPDEVIESACSLCEKQKQTVRGSAGTLCDPCASSGRHLLHDRTSHSEMENSHCPKCGSTEIGVAPVHIEFTEMWCFGCGENELCDVWQLDDWR